MFQTKLLIITFLMVHTIQSSAVGRNRISRIDTLRTDSTQGNRFDKSLQADPRRQSSDSAATNSLAGETTNNVVDNNRANIKNVNIGAANAEPNIQQGDALWNSTNFDLVQDSKTDYVNDTAGTVDRPTRIPTNGTQRMDERKMAMKPDIRTAGAEIKGTAQEVQTAINGSNEMPLSEEAQHNLSKTSPGGPQQTGLSVQAMEELARLAKQNSKTNTSKYFS